MKRYKKKRIVRRKRRISEREIMRIKRKLKKSARKLRLGAKRTGAYVYGTLRRIVGNPAIPAHMGNPDFVREFRIAEMRARLSGEPVGLYAYQTKSGWNFITRKQSMYRPPGEELVVLFGEKRGLRGNPLSYYVGGLSSLGAKRESQRRMRTYNQIKKSIQRGNASYGELAVLQSLAKEHPKLFAGDPMMAEAGGISEAQFRRLRGNQGMIRPDPWIRLKILTPAEALREFHPTRKSISDESEPLLFFRTPTAESPKTIASLARKIGHYNDFNGRKVATVIERIGRIYPKVSIVLGREYSPALWLDNVYEDFAPGFMANAKKFLKTSEESYDPLRRRIRLWWD